MGCWKVSGSFFKEICDFCHCAKLSEFHCCVTANCVPDEFGKASVEDSSINLSIQDNVHCVSQIIPPCLASLVLLHLTKKKYHQFMEIAQLQGWITN